MNNCGKLPDEKAQALNNSYYTPYNGYFRHNDIITFRCNKNFQLVDKNSLLLIKMFEVKCTNDSFVLNSENISGEPHCFPIENVYTLEQKANKPLNLDEMRRVLLKAFRHQLSAVINDVTIVDPAPIIPKRRKRLADEETVVKYTVSTGEHLQIKQLVESYVAYERIHSIQLFTGLPRTEKCVGEKIQNFTFADTGVNSKAESAEKCPQSTRSRALVSCISEITARVVNATKPVVVVETSSSKFDHSTLTITDCNLSLSSITSQVEQFVVINSTQIEDISTDLESVIDNNDTSTAEQQNQIATVLQRITNAAKNTTVSKTTLHAVASIASKLSSAISTTPSSGGNETEQVQETVLQALDTMASQVKLTEDQQEIEVVTEKLSIRVARPQRNATEMSYKPLAQEGEDAVFLVGISLHLPDHLQNESLRVVFIYHSTSALFRGSSNVKEVISSTLLKDVPRKKNAPRIRTRSIHARSTHEPASNPPPSNKISTNATIQYFNQPGSYGIQKSKKGELKTTFRKQTCSYWKDNLKVWSKRGCCLERNTNPPICKCDHTTNFALLVSTHPVPKNVPLDVFSDVSLVFSLVGIFLTFVIHLYDKKLRKKEWTQIQLNIYLNLFIAYLIFLIGVTKVENVSTCNSVAFLLQYTFLTAWFWIAIYGRKVYCSIVQVFGDKNERFMIKAYGFSYGVPLIITMLTSLLSWQNLDREFHIDYCDDKSKKASHEASVYKSYYRGSNLCWLHGYSLYFGFLVIVAIVIIHNSTVVAMVMRETTVKRKSVSSTRKETTSGNAARVVSLTLTLGVGWIFGFLMLFSTNPVYRLVMSWLFTIVNAFQGVWIFYLFCIRPKHVLQVWWVPFSIRFLGRGKDEKRTSMFTVSQTTTTTMGTSTLGRTPVVTNTNSPSLCSETMEEDIEWTNNVVYEG